jgi:hypothetical protein
VTSRIQIALKDTALAERLRALLLHTGAVRIDLVDVADQLDDGVIVTDAERLPKPSSIRKPERYVALAPRRQQALECAWNAGVKSVVYDTEPISTIVLAVMAARLNARQQRGVPAYTARA